MKNRLFHFTIMVNTNLQVKQQLILSKAIYKDYLWKILSPDQWLVNLEMLYCGRPVCKFSLKIRRKLFALPGSCEWQTLQLSSSACTTCPWSSVKSSVTGGACDAVGRYISVCASSCLQFPPVRRTNCDSTRKTKREDLTHQGSSEIVSRLKTQGPDCQACKQLYYHGWQDCHNVCRLGFDRHSSNDSQW